MALFEQAFDGSIYSGAFNGLVVEQLIPNRSMTHYAPKQATKKVGNELFDGDINGVYW